MKKFGLLLIGVIAGIILLNNLGPLVGLVIGLVVMYFSFRGYVKSNTTGRKVMWAIIGLIALAATVSNAPAILAVVAGYVIYLVYKKWNETDKHIKEQDPFTHFEKEWAELKKHY